MKALFQRLRPWLRYALIAAPLVLGMVGLWLQAGESFLQALFCCVNMYVFNYQDPPPNLWVEIARWLAPVATASSLVLLVTALRQRIHNFLARCTGDSFAVRGPEEEKRALLEELGPRGINMGDQLIKAHNYVLLGDEKESLAFYQRYEQTLKYHYVHLQCRGLTSRESTHEKLNLFCPEETAARIFWNEHCLYEQSREAGHQLDIVLIGFGRLGRELLLQALQTNLFDLDQRITYHVFGQEDGFARIYHQLSQISDPVVFHTEPWYEQRDLIDSAAQVIVLEQEDQLALLGDLMHALYRKHFHVFAADDLAPRLIDDQERLELFNWERETLKLENFSNGRLRAAAMRILESYAVKFGGAEAKSIVQEEWESQTPFIRNSNISAANYSLVQQRMLRCEGLEGKELPEDWAERLAELEHVRWCRYHYLHNWRYQALADGKRKDPENRIHTMLIPYEGLDELNKEKDRANVNISIAAVAQTEPQEP